MKNWPENFVDNFSFIFWRTDIIRDTFWNILTFAGGYKTPELRREKSYFPWKCNQLLWSWWRMKENILILTIILIALNTPKLHGFIQIINYLRCGIFAFCLLSYPQNERKIYKLRQLSLSQFVYFLRTEPSMFTFTKYFLREREETKTKYSAPITLI